MTSIPISGNVSGDYNAGNNVIIHYTVTNWSSSDTEVSCDLTASIEHTSLPHLGPDVIFNNQQFRGSRRALILEANAARFAQYVKLHDAVVKATGASVTHGYSK